MATWADRETQLLSIMKSVPDQMVGVITTGIVDALPQPPTTVHASQTKAMAILFFLGGTRDHRPDLLNETYQYRFRVVIPVTDEATAAALLRALREPICAEFDARKTLNGTANIALLTDVQHDPDARYMLAGTPLLFYDYLLAVTAKRAPTPQV